MDVITQAPEPSSRQRRHHIRSRTGCGACKKRHVRCDEKRPAWLDRRGVHGNQMMRSCQAPRVFCKGGHVGDICYTKQRPREASLTSGSTKCLVTGTSCEYLPLERWISETGDGSVSGGSRPNFVGKGGWNVVWQLPKDPRTACPFDSMAFNMSSKSHELLQYCRPFYPSSKSSHLVSLTNVFRVVLDVNSSKDGVTPQRIQIIGKAASNPNSFHGILLLAGLHYHWNNGDLGEFASTYYIHKISWIRSINAYLGRGDHNDPGKFRTYLNIVGTIALIEMSIGDHDAARAHLVGLSILSNRLQSIQQKRLTASDMTNLPSTSAPSADDAVQLYLALIIGDVLAGTSKLLPPAFPHEATGPREPKFLKGTGQILHNGRLALWLVTYFLMASYDISDQHFDLSDFLDYLRMVTTAHGGCHPSPSFPDVLAAESQMNQETPQPPSPFDSNVPWGSTVAAGGAYIHCILGLPWTYGPSTEGGPLCYMIPAIQQDVTAAETAMAGSRVAISRLTEGARLGQALWLWKVVIGACTVASAEKAGLPAPDPEGPGGKPYYHEVVPGAHRDGGRLCDYGDDELYAILAEWWARRLRRWGRATGIMEWKEVRALLALVAWPNNGPGERLAQRIWENASRKCMVVF